MPDPLNEDEFRGERLKANYLGAFGTKQDSVTRLGGIFRPEKMKLSAGEVIYRLGNKARTDQDDRFGRWWMLESTLLLNAEYAVDIDSLVRLLRQNLAVPPAFSPLGRIHVATLQSRLSTFAGVGNAIWRDSLPAEKQQGAPPLLAGGIERDGSSRGVWLRFQLYIPGLRECGARALEFGPVLTLSEWFSRFRLGSVKPAHVNVPLSSAPGR